jgi:hypothetical protein
MVEVFCDLSQFTILPCRVCDLPDVMMWTDKDQMIGIVEESSACLNLRPPPGRNQRLVELRFDTSSPTRPDDRAARQCFGLLNESQEIRLLDVVEEARDPLIDMVAIRQPLEFRIEEPAQLEYRWKAIVDDGEWCTCLCRAGQSRVRPDDRTSLAPPSTTKLLQFGHRVANMRYVREAVCDARGGRIR